MRHFELGTHRPSAGLVGALQIGHAQEDVCALTGADAHAAGTVGADELVRAHAQIISATSKAMFSGVMASPIAMRISEPAKLSLAVCTVSFRVSSRCWALARISSSTSRFFSRRSFMAIHSKADVERMARRLTERYEALLKVMDGVRETTHTTATGSVPGVIVRSEDIRYAVDDVATGIREIKSRLGKG